ncbi:MAG TPA: hypothetical protein VFD70_27950, partial [Anaerolineae bacterium]|nr:hypothetical protein [Anaerolineae bacterium]
MADMGARGEGWVIGQVVIGAAILAASVFAPIEVPIFVRAVGVVLLIVGGVVALLGIFTLGSNLTPFPKPKEESHTLTTTGVYALVR